MENSASSSYRPTLTIVIEGNRPKTLSRKQHTVAFDLKRPVLASILAMQNYATSEPFCIVTG
jgi:hypothetical protein